MQEALAHIASYVSLGLAAIAILLIVFGAVEATVAISRTLLSPQTRNADKRAVWLEFARWLIAALTFQLAADIVATTIAPTWDDIGRVAAVAAIRTVLTVFLDHDIDSMRRVQRRSLSDGDEAKRA